MGIRRGNYQPVFQMPANAMVTPETNGAPLSRNLDIPARLFDDTTAEKVQGSFWLPDNFKASAPVIITAAVEPATPAAANVAYTLSYKALADGGIVSAPWTTPGATPPAHAVDATANKIFFHEQSFSGLSWSAGDLVLFQFARYTGVASNLSGDLRLYHLIIEIPVS